MAQAERPRNMGMQQQNMSVSNNFPEDLLQRFISRKHINHKLREDTEEEEDEKEVELSLGLSLNGKFGVDPRNKTLSRSSSIPDFINQARENGITFAVPVMDSNLGRTYSLPTEREEWRKKKEMQTRRRMEAKRKRSEKQRNLKAVKDWKKEFGEGGFEEDKRENGIVGNHNNYHQEQLIKNFYSLSGAGLDRLITSALVPPAPLSQGSIGSHVSGSSGISESESQQVQGINQCAEVRSPADVQFLKSEQKMMVNSGSTASEKSGSFVGHPSEDKSHKLAVTEMKAKEVLRNVFDDMPCVSTRGDGPNGKRIEGFLYRYGKGKEVRIVCVCHGSFFSPAEFVKHGGGVEVEHPLKHIVVNPSPLL